MILSGLTIKEVYNHLNTKSVPSTWMKSKQRIEKDYQYLQQLLNENDPPRIYGVNTLVGHLDEENLSDQEVLAFQDELIRNHKIGTEPYFDEFTARCIGFVKVNQVSSGGTCISPELYEKLMDVIFKEDFKPEIPKHASYSSGDVIPGAHWAYELQTYLSKNKSYTLRPKEGLSLINGSFVHVGYALSLFIQVNNVWKNFVYNSILNAILVKANKTNYTEYLYTDPNAVPTAKIQRRIWSILNRQQRDYTRQDPVSIRALPQILSSFYDSIISFKHTLELELNKRSDNPLIVYEAKEPLSQGSFLSPNLTMDTSKLIECLLMVMWHLERRVHYLLSGEVEGIPLNGSTAKNPLGYIQVPKLMTAILEEARLIGGRRSFASGGSTSYGIEDFWTHGIETTHILEKILQKISYMLSIELVVSVNVYRQFYNDKLKEFSVPEMEDDDFDTLSKTYRETILNGEIKFMDKFVDNTFL